MCSDYGTGRLSAVKKLFSFSFFHLTSILGEIQTKKSLLIGLIFSLGRSTTVVERFAFTTGQANQDFCSGGTIRTFIRAFKGPGPTIRRPRSNPPFYTATQTSTMANSRGNCGIEEYFILFSAIKRRFKMFRSSCSLKEAVWELSF